MQRKLDQIEIEFCKSLKKWFETQYKPGKKGAVSKFANLLGISQGHMSQILIGQKCFKSEFERRAVSKIIGLKYSDMIRGASANIGFTPTADAEIIKADPYSNITELEHTDIIRQFQNKPLAKIINERLLNLEKLNPAAMDKVLGFVEGLITGYQSSFVDRRKSDQTDKMPISGDRRKVG